VEEDAPAGIEAARNAGMPVIALATSHPAASLATADVLVPALSALRIDVTASRLRISFPHS
jgi:sugar-phosphatase